MNELITINQSTINNELVQTVNARELHAFLQVKSRFNDWFANRVNDYDFVENQDFIAVTKNLVNGGKMIDYFLSLDMGKELSMVERNDKGREARKYFIDCEKQLLQKTQQLALPDFSNPAIAARAWAEQYEQRQALEQQAKIDAPKVEFANAVMGSNDTKDMKQVAKIIALSGWGRNKIFDLLREHRILDRHNQPYQRYVDNGWFRQVESKYQMPSGEIRISVKTVVFQKGINGIRKLINNEMEVSA